jgi:catechol-2,3-dioxygenase
LTRFIKQYPDKFLYDKASDIVVDNFVAVEQIAAIFRLTPSGNLLKHIRISILRLLQKQQYYTTQLSYKPLMANIWSTVLIFLVYTIIK